jgi:hypothetical protein
VGEEPDEFANPTGSAGACGRASAMSAAATRNPSSIQSCSIGPACAGSQTTPEGWPYMTTKRGGASGGRTRASHGPAQAKERGSAIGTNPSRSPPSQRETVGSVAGSPQASGFGSASNASSKIDARQDRKLATCRSGSESTISTSFTPEVLLRRPQLRPNEAETSFADVENLVHRGAVPSDDSGSGRQLGDSQHPAS